MVELTSRCQELEKEACEWLKKGAEGGGIVGMEHYSAASCYVKALKLNPRE